MWDGFGKGIDWWQNDPISREEASKLIASGRGKPPYIHSGRWRAIVRQLEINDAVRFRNTDTVAG